MKSAIVLCSGGLDSVVTSYYAKKRLGYKNMIILFFNYAQKTIEQERKYSKKCASDLNAEFIEIDLKWLGNISGSLINKKGKIKKIRKIDLKNTQKESQRFYVPCRNTIFFAYALAFAESRYMKTKEKLDIFAGFKCEGKESYPDTTKDFVKKINALAKVSCIGKFYIKAPLINKDKEDIIKIGKRLGVDFKKTFSCYASKGNHCGSCLACKLRQAGFYWANENDPTEYQTDF